MQRPYPAGRSLPRSPPLSPPSPLSSPPSSPPLSPPSSPLSSPPSSPPSPPPLPPPPPHRPERRTALRYRSGLWPTGLAHFQPYPDRLPCPSPSGWPVPTTASPPLATDSIRSSHRSERRIASRYRSDPRHTGLARSHPYPDRLFLATGTATCPGPRPSGGGPFNQVAEPVPRAPNRAPALRWPVPATASPPPPTESIRPGHRSERRIASRYRSDPRHTGPAHSHPYPDSPLLATGTATCPDPRPSGGGPFNPADEPVPRAPNRVPAPRTWATSPALATAVRHQRSALLASSFTDALHKAYFHPLEVIPGLTIAYGALRMEYGVQLDSLHPLFCNAGQIEACVLNAALKRLATDANNRPDSPPACSSAPSSTPRGYTATIPLPYSALLAERMPERDFGFLHCTLAPLWKGLNVPRITT